MKSTPREEQGGAAAGVLADAPEQRGDGNSSEAQLMEERARLAALRSSFDGVVLVGSDGRFLDANAAACSLLGYSRDELLAMSLADVEVPGRSDAAAALATTREQGSFVFETVNRRKDGTLIDVEVSATLVPETGQLFGYFRDITARRRSVASIADSEARFRALFESHGAVMALVRPSDGGIEDANEAAVQFYGYDRATLRRMKVWELNVLGQDESLRLMRQAAAGLLKTRVVAHRIASGEIRMVEINATPVDTPDGRLVFSIVQDVTDRLETERALRESEQKYRMLADNSTDVIFRFDLDEMRLTYVSPSVERLRGYTPDEVLRQSEEELLTPDSRARLRSELSDAMVEFRNGRPGTVTIELEQPRRDGSTVLTEVTARFAVDPESGHVQAFGSSRDITARKKIEAELENSRANLEAVFASTEDLIFSVDLDYRLVTCNRAFEAYVASVFGRMVAPGRGAPDLLPPEFAANWAPMLDRARSDGAFRTEYAGAGGRTLDFSFAPVHRGGEVVGISVFGKDVTAQKAAMNALREANQRLSLHTRRMPLGLLCGDLQNRITEWNPAAERIFGWTREEAIGKHGHDLLVPRDQRPLVEAALGRVFAGSLDAHNVNENVTRSGERITCEWFNAPLTDAEGTITGTLSMVADITERVRNEQRIRESERRFRSLMESVNLVSLMLDRDGRVTYCNDFLLQLIGCRREEILGASWFETCIPPEHAGLFAQYREAMETGVFPVTYENPILTRAGDARLIAWNNSILLDADGRPTGIASLGEDVTEQKRTRQALELAHFALEHSADPVYWNRPDATFLDVNEAAVRQLGYSREELLARRLEDVVPGLGAEEWEQHWNEIRSAGSLVHPGQHRRKDGSEFDAEITHNYIRFGEHEYLCSFIRDVSERNRAEAALRASEARLREAVELQPIPVAIAHGNDLMAYFNQKFVETFGYTVETIRTMADWMEHAYPDPEYRSRAVAQWMTDLREAAAEGRSTVPREYVVTCADGTTKFVMISGRQIGDQLFGSFVDMTRQRVEEENRRSLEGQLHHLQRLESVGRLAGGVAHDINNVLAAIMAVASVIELGEGEDASQASIILKACERGRNLLKSLMEFARREVQNADLVDLNELVRKEVDLLSNTTMQKVRIDVDLAAGLPKIIGSSTALGTALMNLCVNALDAMPDGGTLTLRTESVENGEVLLTVEDTGQGMTPEVRSRAMEPFFTTKPVGKGTGLGLSIVYGTVQAHAGTVEIHSRPGEGTRVCLRLPLGTGVRGEGAATQHPHASAGPPLRILLIDDDPLVRQSAPALLATLGHAVTVADGGAAALELLEQGLEPAAVLLDLNMPGMDGMETFRRLRQIRPRLPVLIVSGYADNLVLRKIEELGHARFLPKPYTLDEMRWALAQLR